MVSYFRSINLWVWDVDQHLTRWFWHWYSTRVVCKASYLMGYQSFIRRLWHLVSLSAGGSPMGWNRLGFHAINGSQKEASTWRHHSRSANQRPAFGSRPHLDNFPDERPTTVNSIWRCYEAAISYFCRWCDRNNELLLSQMEINTGAGFV